MEKEQKKREEKSSLTFPHHYNFVLKVLCELFQQNEMINVIRTIGLLTIFEFGGQPVSGRHIEPISNLFEKI